MTFFPSHLGPEAKGIDVPGFLTEGAMGKKLLSLLVFIVGVWFSLEE